MPKRTLATACGTHSDKAALRAQGINPNKRLAGLNIRTVPQRMTAQNEPPAPGDESGEEPAEEPAEAPADEEAEEEAEEEPAAKRRKTTKAAGGKRKRASDDDDEDDEEAAEESEEPEERPRKRAKPAANKKPARKAKSPKRKNKKKAANKKVKESEDEPEDESGDEPEDEAHDPMRLWEVRDIIAEQMDSSGQLQYLVDWEDNPETGEKYDPTWVCAEPLTCSVLSFLFFSFLSFLLCNLLITILPTGFTGAGRECCGHFRRYSRRMGRKKSPEGEH